MTNLSNFPKVKHAFQTILTSCGSKTLVDGNLDEAQMVNFQKSEDALSLVYDKTLGDLNLSPDAWAEIQTGVDADTEYSALLAVVLPCDDNDIIVLKAAGADDEQIEVLRSTLDNFFNGGDFDNNFVQ